MKFQRYLLIVCKYIPSITKYVYNVIYIPNWAFKSICRKKKNFRSGWSWSCCSRYTFRWWCRSHPDPWCPRRQNGASLRRQTLLEFSQDFYQWPIGDQGEKNWIGWTFSQSNSNNFSRKETAFLKRASWDSRYKTTLVFLSPKYLTTGRDHELKILWTFGPSAKVT